MRVSRAFIVYRALIGHPVRHGGSVRPRLLFFTFAWKDSLVCKVYIFFIKRLKTDEFVVTRSDEGAPNSYEP
jgi:hypothetical protein